MVCPAAQGLSAVLPYKLWSSPTLPVSPLSWSTKSCWPAPPPINYLLEKVSVASSPWSLQLISQHTAAFHRIPAEARLPAGGWLLWTMEVLNCPHLGTPAPGSTLFSCPQPHSTGPFWTSCPGLFQFCLIPLGVLLLHLALSVCGCLKSFCKLQDYVQGLSRLVENSLWLCFG